MIFVVSSSAILARLQTVSRAVPSKSQFDILYNILFQLKDNVLSLTASDLETTIRTTMEIADVQEEGTVCISAKLINDSLKDFPEQPITFSYPEGSKSIEITWATGKFTVPVFPAADYPEYPRLEEAAASVNMPSDVLLEGISRCLYATASEELRPVMNGIFFDLKDNSLNMVASDAHKLVCFHRDDISCTEGSGFILSKKPASILKTILPKIDDQVCIRFDAKNAYIGIKDVELFSRRVEGVYPAYRSVIPKNNNNKAITDRVELLKAVRRVSVFSNQGSNLIRLHFSSNEIYISAQDTEFNISSYDRVPCQFDGTDMEIGFKSTFLSEILDNLPGQECCIALSDPARAGLFTSNKEENEHQDTCALLMPMMLTNA